MPPSELADHQSERGSGMFPLLRRCIESGDAEAWEAWGELFLLVEEVASRRVRWVLRCAGVSTRETEPVVLELFEELYFDECRKLRSCWAQSEAEFRAWLWQVATHFARNWVDRRQRAVAKEKAARSEIPLPDRSGPDEATIQARLEEWQPLMRPRDFDRLRVLLGLTKPDRPISDRTRQHWTQQLLQTTPTCLAPSDRRGLPVAATDLAC